MLSMMEFIYVIYVYALPRGTISLILGRPFSCSTSVLRVKLFVTGSVKLLLALANHKHAALETCLQ